jgi:hypothetical protein
MYYNLGRSALVQNVVQQPCNASGEGASNSQRSFAFNIERIRLRFAVDEMTEKQVCNIRGSQ